MIKRKLLGILITFSLVVSGSYMFAFYNESHAYEDDYDDYSYYDDDDEYVDPDTCDHSWDEDDVICDRKATLKKNGIAIYTCTNCGTQENESYKWELNPPDSIFYQSYNVKSFSTVFRNSKSITVKLDNVVKGSVLKVKIGKKTYKKKLGSKKKVKIKIKKPVYGSKITFSVYYKGRKIGKYYEYDSDDDEYFSSWDIVYYAKNIKKGMTKKQVKNLYYWGSPDSTASASGNWSFWYYDDGSYVDFEKGKVVYWYDAAK